MGIVIHHFALLRDHRRILMSTVRKKFTLVIEGAAKRALSSLQWHFSYHSIVTADLPVFVGAGADEITLWWRKLMRFTLSLWLHFLTVGKLWCPTLLLKQNLDESRTDHTNKAIRCRHNDGEVRMARLQGTLQTSHRCNIIDIEYLRLHDLLSSNERVLERNIVLDYRQLFHLDRVLVDRFVEQVRYGGADHDRKQDR